LDGRERLVLIPGEVFQVCALVSADIPEVNPANLREILSRARRELYEYLRDNSSLVDQKNDCKCARKTRGFVQAGFVNPHKLQFTQRHHAEGTGLPPIAKSAKDLPAIRKLVQLKLAN
jgi:hypothetical protein